MQDWKTIARIATVALLLQPSGRRYWFERVRLPRFDRYYDVVQS
jgi:hypothetical protein